MSQSNGISPERLDKFTYTDDDLHGVMFYRANGDQVTPAQLASADGDDTTVQDLLDSQDEGDAD